MAQTIQSISHAFVETAQMQYTTSSSSSVYSDKPKIEDNMDILLSIFDNMCNLYITLEKLHHIIKMKHIELKIILKENDH